MKEKGEDHGQEVVEMMTKELSSGEESSSDDNSSSSSEDEVDLSSYQKAKLRIQVCVMHEVHFGAIFCLLAEAPS